MITNELCNGRTEPFIAHNSEWELLLIRVGHRLWQEYRRVLSTRDARELHAIENALDSVWECKRLYREHVREDRRVAGNGRKWERRRT